MVKRKKCVVYTAVTLFVSLTILVLNILWNLLTIFTAHRGTSSLCDHKLQNMVSENTNSPFGFDYFPRHIHQIFFNVTDKTIPVDLEFARKSWVVRNPTFKYTLWSSKMVLDLLESKYPELLPLYKSYSHWVRRADVARYVILYEYGGVYVDLDIGSRGKTDVLIYNILRKETRVAFYLTKPFGVSNDFMIATPYHPFFRHVICGLEDGNRWYGLPFLTTMFMTGPGYLYARYKTYDTPKEIQILGEGHLKAFIKHQDGGAWHGIDAKIIWWLFIRWTRLDKRLLNILICVIILTLIVLYRFKQRINRSLSVVLGS